MKRILVLITAALVMAAMMLAMAMPAFAAQPRYTCTQEGHVTAGSVIPKDVHYYKSLGYTCTKNV